MKTRTIKSLHEVAYPVFKLPGEPLVVDGLVYVEGYMYDDRNVSRRTLGERRLLSPHHMTKIKSCCEDEVDIMKTAGAEPWFIDNLGSCFKYRRTSYQKLVCHEIKDVVYRDTYSLILLNGVNFPVIVKRPPVGSFGQMIYYRDLPWKLYNIYYEPIKPSRKKV